MHHLLTFFLCTFLMSCVPSTPSIEATFGEPFTVGIGQEVRIGDDIVFRVDKLISDSRCAMDVQCFWEGNVTVAITINGEQAEAISGQKTSTTPASVWLSAIEPPPVSVDESIAPEEYRFTFTLLSWQ